MTEYLDEVFLYAIQGSLEKTKSIITTSKFDINYQESTQGYSALHIACFAGSDAVVSFLLSRPDINVNSQDHSGLTPFHLACFEGQFKIVQMLMKDSRVDIQQTCHYGSTPFYVACAMGHLNVVEELLADARSSTFAHTPNKDGATPLWIACYNDRLSILKALLSSKRNLGDLDVKPFKNPKSITEVIKEKHRQDIFDLITSYEQGKQTYIYITQIQTQ